MLNSLKKRKKAEEGAREQLTHMLGNSVPRIVSGQILYLEAPTRKQYDQRKLSPSMTQQPTLWAGKK